VGAPHVPAGNKPPHADTHHAGHNPVVLQSCRLAVLPSHSLAKQAQVRHTLRSPSTPDGGLEDAVVLAAGASHEAAAHKAQVTYGGGGHGFVCAAHTYTSELVAAMLSVKRTGETNWEEQGTFDLN
jgi:hypothetical protein